jgi:ubiquinone/menaquinone biosynthesis C-methylase UbiE
VSRLFHAGQDQAVSFYSQRIFPRLCDLVLSRPFVAKLRRELLANTHGDVLEIGFGTGLNLPHYPQQVRKITTVDPNAGMNRLAQKRIKESGTEVEQWILSGERLTFEDNTFDFAVSTFTLCSIENASQAAGEIYRVLKTGGKFLFLEHGLSPEPHVQKWQRRLNWLETRLADGCRLDRAIDAIVGAQPFSSVEVECFYLPWIPKTHGFWYRGRGVK